jgi:protein-disulfide isomerase
VIGLPPQAKPFNSLVRFETPPHGDPIVNSILPARAWLASLAVIAGLALPAAAAPKPEGTVDMATVLKPGPLPELSLGPATGVPIIEYGSLTCPHCAAFDKDVMPKLRAQYIDTGKVHFIFREFSRNPLDVAAFVLARCVGDDRALATIELLFSRQDDWAFVKSPLEPLIAAVRPTGLSHEKAIACLEDEKKEAAMQQIEKTAVDVVKVQGTPTFVIDGKVYGGELSMKDFDEILKPLIKTSEAEAPAKP